MAGDAKSRLANAYEIPQDLQEVLKNALERAKQITHRAAVLNRNEKLHVDNSEKEVFEYDGSSGRLRLTLKSEDGTIDGFDLGDTGAGILDAGWEQSPPDRVRRVVDIHSGEVDGAAPLRGLVTIAEATTLQPQRPGELSGRGIAKAIKYILDTLDTKLSDRENNVAFDADAVLAEMIGETFLAEPETG